uniref:Uncharacterized protein n=1 Tax=Falco tinnunculus TaxID=100819 RepID=A0A8C4TXU9_FALTI
FFVCLKCHSYLFIFVVHTSCSFTTYFPQITVNKRCICEGLGLREIPEKLPVTTDNVDFSFNVVSSLQNSTFSELKSLIYLDLIRYRSILTSAHHTSKTLCPCQSQSRLEHTTAASPLSSQENYP